MTISAPGFYDIPSEEYHADPCPEPSLSKSIGAIMLSQSPRHAFWSHPRLNPDHVSVNKAIYDIGKAAEALLLGMEAQFVIVDAADWKTKAAREARDAAWAEGKIPMLAEKMADIRKMAEAARAQLATHRDASDAFTNGRTQQTMAWQEETLHGTIWCRSLLDWMPNDRGGVVTLEDFKSTEGSANPDVWINRMYESGGDVQAAFYTRGYCRLTGKDPADVRFRFVVQESKPPFALCTIGLDPRALELANAKVEEMIALWARCMEAGAWPGYPAHTCWISPPVREEYRRQERDLRKKMMQDAGEDEFRALMQWYEPLDRLPEGTTNILGGG